MSDRNKLHGWIGAVCAAVLLLGSQSAEARDVRLALLVGHQVGWKKDPRLQYALTGDLRPLAATLRRLGFFVKTVENRGPAEVRKALKWVEHRVGQSPKVSTFLFYYSGHSDKQYLHLGPRSQGKPLSYQEMVKSFKSLRVARRFIILDSCFSGEIIRKFGSLRRYRSLVPKGARARRWIDLSRSIPNQGDQQSLQVISSGLAVSWESKRYKASIFTHHLLRGLRGRADQNRDGKISLNELFDFVSQAMMQDIQEKPKLFGVVTRSQSYALAPAYHSKLWIGAGVTGQLQVSVSNFYWMWNKRRRYPVRLALVHGKGEVKLQQGKRCWRQSIHIPKGREVRLRGSWKPMRCRMFARRSKGSVSLSTQAHSTAPPRWKLEGRGGLLGLALSRAPFFGGGEISLRRRYFGISLGAWGTHEAVGGQQLLFHLRMEAGYRHRWRWLSLFGGGFLETGLLMQNVDAQAGAGLVIHYGLVFAPTFWITERWGLHIHGRMGFTVARLGDVWAHRFAWSGLAGITFAL